MKKFYFLSIFCLLFSGSFFTNAKSMESNPDLNNSVEDILNDFDDINSYNLSFDGQGDDIFSFLKNQNRLIDEKVETKKTAKKTPGCGEVVMDFIFKCEMHDDEDEMLSLKEMAENAEKENRKRDREDFYLNAKIILNEEILLEKERMEKKLEKMMSKAKIKKKQSQALNPPRKTRVQNRRSRVYKKLKAQNYKKN